MTAPWNDPRVVAGMSRQLARRRTALDGGARHLGWKVAFGAPASLERMEITAPLVGYLTDATLVEPGATISTGDWTAGVIEFEVAVWMGSDLGPEATPAEARAAVTAVGAAIEFADVDLAPIDAAAVEEILAGDIFHAGLVLGAPDASRSGLDTTGLHARISVDGEPLTTVDDLSALTGDHGRIVAVVADTLAACGLGLRQGDLVITGSVVPPMPLERGRRYDFALEPLRRVSVNVT